MRLKDHFIKMVTDELDHLNGSEFEAMCRPLLEIITGREIELKGHNLEMKPVKCTVDLIQDEDYKVIGHNDYAAFISESRRIQFELERLIEPTDKKVRTLYTHLMNRKKNNVPAIITKMEESNPLYMNR